MFVDSEAIPVVEEFVNAEALMLVDRPVLVGSVQNLAESSFPAHHNLVCSSTLVVKVLANIVGGIPLALLALYNRTAIDFHRCHRRNRFSRRIYVHPVCMRRIHNEMRTPCTAMLHNI